MVVLRENNCFKTKFKSDEQEF